MQIQFSEEVDRELNKIKQKDQLLIKRIEKQLALFQENPRHPSLRLHKLSGGLNELWSISISKGIRMVYIQDEDMAYFVDLGTHDEVYRK